MAALLVVLGIVLVVRGVTSSKEPALATAAQAEAALEPTGSPSPSEPSPSRPSPTTPSIGTHAATPSSARPVAAPTTFSVPSEGISMTVESTGVGSDGQMRMPPNIHHIGWYEYGPPPGSDTGAVVFAGHVDSKVQGVGPLAKLRGLSQGDTIRIRLDDGSTVSYTVETVTRIRKDQLDLGAVFDRSGPGRLHVLTCGGPFDAATGHYEDNILVTASPTG